MSKLTNEFSWSKTRYDVFNECLRKYYYQFYGSWGGWEADAPSNTRQLYVLKQLKTRWMWSGEVVHNCLQRILSNLCKGITPLPVENILDLTRKLMRTDFRSSRDKHYWKEPKTCALFEHEYQISVAQEEWQQTVELAERALSNFFNSMTFRNILSLPKQDILEIENFSFFELDGFKINVKLDFCCKMDEQIYIYDWKTGKPKQSVDFQLACYALYAQKHWGIELNNCKIIEYNLADDRVNQLIAAPEFYQAVTTRIMESIHKMNNLLKDKRHNLADEADFPQTSQINTCKWCNFVRVCRPEMATTLS